MDLWTKILAGVLRAALAPALLWLTSRGIINETESTQVIIALAGILLAGAWSAWQKIVDHRERQALISALAMVQSAQSAPPPRAA